MEKTSVEYWTEALERIDRRQRSLAGTEDQIFAQVERLARLEMFARACLMLAEDKSDGKTEIKSEAGKIAPEW